MGAHYAVHPGQALVNVGSLNNYAAQPSGVDYLPAPLTDPATVTVAAPTNTKSLVTTSEASTTGNNVAIGEIARYHLAIQIPHATSPNLPDHRPASRGLELPQRQHDQGRLRLR